jgi:hypothetical protein
MTKITEYVEQQKLNHQERLEKPLSFSFGSNLKQEMENRRLLSKKELDTLKKWTYANVSTSFVSKTGRGMTEARFYSHTVHLKYEDDWRSVKKHYDWCREHGVPFGAYFVDKFFIKHGTTKTIGSGTGADAKGDEGVPRA